MGVLRSVALMMYDSAQREFHMNYERCVSRLIVSKTHPHIAGSQDGFSRCDCCGVTSIEVKCPYTYRNVHPTEIFGVASTCFTIDGQLRTNHRYYAYL